MAFFCPIRVRKGKKKKDDDVLDGRAPTLSRITGSSSIETLVRVGLEKENLTSGLTSSETKMIVLHDFVPCVDDELEVKRGQIVNVLYQENDWVYVISEGNNNSEGFIPFSYCTPLSSPLAQLVRHKKLPRNSNNSACKSLDTGQETDTYSSIAISDIHPFFKDPSGKFVVLYTFIARDENDVSVERGEFVTVLNKDDNDWFWIIRSDGHEGFVPSSFVCPFEVAFGKKQHNLMSITNQVNGTMVASPPGPIMNGEGIGGGGGDNNQIPSNSNHNGMSRIPHNQEPSGNGHYQKVNAVTSIPLEDSTTYSNSGMSGNSQGFGGLSMSASTTELVMLYDYKAQAPDDLSVRRGEWIYADLSNQTIEGWLWAYAPKLGKYGFIPKAYARPPAMTSI